MDVLIDASGSQMKRQGDVALQAYIISEALSNVDIPHQGDELLYLLGLYDPASDFADTMIRGQRMITSLIMLRLRTIVTDLAIRTAGYDLLQREEEKKIMIILSDGRPYDVIVNRPNAKNPEPYQGKAAVADTATEVRRLRNLDVSVLGVFAGEEKDLATEKKIFGKDFAYIRDIANFSKIVGRYLTKQLEIDG